MNARLMKKIAFLALLSGSCVVPLDAFAVDAASALGGRNEPIEISADSLEVLQANQKAVFRGKVEVHQGAVMLTAHTMTVYYHQQAAGAKTSAVEGAAGSVSRIEADGSVMLATKEETARGHKGIYDVDARKVTLLGDVMLTRGKNILKGEKLTYNLDTGRSVLGSGDTAADGGQSGVAKPAGGRIKALFVPDKK